MPANPEGLLPVEQRHREAVARIIAKRVDTEEERFWTDYLDVADEILALPAEPASTGAAIPEAEQSLARPGMEIDAKMDRVLQRALVDGMTDIQVVDREAIRREAFEEAARVADEWAERWKRDRDKHDDNFWDGGFQAYEQWAATLRALSPTTAPIDQAQGVGDG